MRGTREQTPCGRAPSRRTCEHVILRQRILLNTLICALQPSNLALDFNRVSLESTCRCMEDAPASWSLSPSLRRQKDHCMFVVSVAILNSYGLDGLCANKQTVQPAARCLARCELTDHPRKAIT